MPQGTSENVAVYVHSSSVNPSEGDTVVHVADTKPSANVPPDGEASSPEIPQTSLQDARGSSLSSSISRIESSLSDNVFTHPPPSKYSYFVAAMACLNSCNLGYDVGSVGGAALLMQEEFEWSSWDLSFYVGTFGPLNIL